MKFATISKSVVLGLALVLATSALAATKASLSLTHPTTVNGIALNAGNYKLEWEGTGPQVEVSIVKGKNVVAKVPAKLVDISSPTRDDEAVFNRNIDGSMTLAGVRFQGKKYGLEIGESSDGMQSGSSK